MYTARAPLFFSLSLSLSPSISLYLSISLARSHTCATHHAHARARAQENPSSNIVINQSSLLIKPASSNTASQGHPLTPHTPHLVQRSIHWYTLLVQSAIHFTPQLNPAAFKIICFKPETHHQNV